LNASNEGEIHAAFTTLNKLQAAALLVGGDPFFNTRREQLVTLANHYAIPAIYEVRRPRGTVLFTVVGVLARGLDFIGNFPCARP
jgi:hypothetical protein